MRLYYSRILCKTINFDVRDANSPSTCECEYHEGLLVNLRLRSLHYGIIKVNELSSNSYFSESQAWAEPQGWC